MCDTARLGIPGLLLLLLAAGGCGMGEIVAPMGGIWGRSAGGTGDDYSQALAVSADGSVFMTGRLDGEVTFGAGRLDETVLTAAGVRDAFVAKYDRHGRLDWAVTAGGDDDDCGRGIATAGDGTVLVTGSFMGAATFGAGESAETTLVADSGNDIFIAKYEPDGHLRWARSVGGIDHDWGYDIAAAADGGVFITGEYQRDATFGAGEANGATLSVFRSKDIFVARYGADGDLSWVRRAGGDGDNTGHAIASAEDGGVYVTGEFRQSAVFGEGEANQTTLEARSAADVFVAKYADDGSLVWAVRAGSASAADISDDVGWDVAGVAGGGVFVTGSFGMSAVFGAGEAQTTLTASGLTHLFLAKYDDDGNLVWVERSTGSFIDVGTGVAATAEGGAVVTGRFHGTTSFAAGEIDEIGLESIGLFDIVAARFSAHGEIEWAMRAGGYTGEDTGHGIAVTDDDGILITGAFGERAVFDNHELGSTTLQSKGMRDAFIAKLRP